MRGNEEKKEWRWGDEVGYHRWALKDCLLGLRIHVDMEFVGFVRAGACASRRVGWLNRKEKRDRTASFLVGERSDLPPAACRLSKVR